MLVSCVGWGEEKAEEGKTSLIDLNTPEGTGRNAVDTSVHSSREEEDLSLTLEKGSKVRGPNAKLTLHVKALPRAGTDKDSKRRGPHWCFTSYADPHVAATCVVRGTGDMSNLDKLFSTPARTLLVDLLLERSKASRSRKPTSAANNDGPGMRHIPAAFDGGIRSCRAIR